MKALAPINSVSGILPQAEQICSPHCDARPQDAVLDLIVIHAISLPPGVYGENYITDLFCGCLDKTAHPYFADIAHLRVSSHLLLRRDGHVIQYVPFHCRAWHAGVSEYKGRTACNDFSIGIELEGCDQETFTDDQYQKLHQIIKVLCQAYPKLSSERVVGHSDIAPGRKTDPGPHFDWSRLHLENL